MTELAYRVVPVPTIKELDELLPRITIPMLIFVSREDYVVPPTNVEHILHQIRSTEKRLCWLESSYHVAPLDNDKGLIVQESLAFLQAHA